MVLDPARPAPEKIPVRRGFSRLGGMLLLRFDGGN
jgi:hypothetical protein